MVVRLLSLRFGRIVELLLVAIEVFASVCMTEVRGERHTHWRKYSPSASAHKGRTRQFPSPSNRRGCRKRTVMMTEMLHPFEVRQSPHTTRDKLPHRQDPIPVGIEPLEHRIDDLGRLRRVYLEVLRSLALLLVVNAVDRLELVAVKDAVAVLGREKGGSARVKKGEEKRE